MCIQRSDISDWLEESRQNIEAAEEQGCQIFLDTKYKTGENIPKYYQMSISNAKLP
jgi:hypothetical protein